MRPAAAPARSRPQLRLLRWPAAGSSSSTLAHWLAPGCPPPCPPQDNGSEHPHRVCISARADVTPGLVSELEQRTAGAGLQVRPAPHARAGAGSRENAARAAPAQPTQAPPAAATLDTHHWTSPRALAPPPSPHPHHLPPQVKIIVSGTGDWRYVDVTAARAGKLAALEYVRQLYGVHHSRCVAAGDSGNDTLMLGGRNLAIGGWPAGGWARAWAAWECLGTVLSAAGEDVWSSQRAVRPRCRCCRRAGSRLLIPNPAAPPLPLPLSRSGGQRAAGAGAVGAGAAAGGAAGGDRRAAGPRHPGGPGPPRPLLMRQPPTEPRSPLSSLLRAAPRPGSLSPPSPGCCLGPCRAPPAAAWAPAEMRAQCGPQPAAPSAASTYPPGQPQPPPHVLCPAWAVHSPHPRPCAEINAPINSPRFPIATNPLE